MSNKKNILIIGAGDAGKLLYQDIIENFHDCNVIGFIDDIKKDDNMKILGVIEDIPKINEIYRVDEIIIAIPSTDGALVRNVLLKNIGNRIPIKIVPRNQKIISLRNVKYSEIKDIDPEDFLGRSFINKNVEELKKFYKDKIIFITGGAGSIGSEIVQQLIDLGVKKVIVYDSSEYLIFNLDQILKEKGIQEKCDLIIGNILNKNKLSSVIGKLNPDIIFHAAAYKHVYLMEDNVDEAVLNNLIGTKNVIDATLENKVSQFTFISTDKVVNPTSVMGATKKLCEFYIKGLSHEKTKFNIVRFGNVINSNGSVLPLFERQIKNFKYVTVTHKEIMRFFMSIREAAQLVIESTSRNADNAIYILNMGELLNIFEIAECLIRSKNLIPHKDVEIKITGLRKGEKMIEELFTDLEESNILKTEINNVYKLKNFEECILNINDIFDDLSSLVLDYSNVSELKKYFKKIFPSLKEN